MGGVDKQRGSLLDVERGELYIEETDRQMVRGRGRLGLRPLVQVGARQVRVK